MKEEIDATTLFEILDGVNRFGRQENGACHRVAYSPCRFGCKALA